MTSVGGLEHHLPVAGYGKNADRLTLIGMSLSTSVTQARLRNRRCSYLYLRGPIQQRALQRLSR
jgi:hypothetical protein